MPLVMSASRQAWRMRRSGGRADRVRPATVLRTDYARKALVVGSKQFAGVRMSGHSARGGRVGRRGQ